MVIYQSQDFASSYETALRDLIYDPEYVTQPRDMKIKEMCDVAIVVENPLSCLYQNEYRSSQFKYIAAEFMWYFMGRNDVEFIAKYAKFWESIQNLNGTVNSSYGHLLFNNKNEHGLTQYSWALESLLKDKDSRQAVMHFNLPVHQKFSNKDFVCTMYGIFQIRNNKLNFTVHMRSNDVILGLPTDIAFFAVLQSQMLFHLRWHGSGTYQNLELGTYTHFANSFHIYERNFELAERMLTKKFESLEIPKVNQSLITTTGKTSSAFTELFNDYNISLTDPLFLWIQKNINL